jgi:hypothetical protein
MPVKNIVIPLETEYLQAEARARGVSRTMITRLIMEQVIERKLVAEIVGPDRIVTTPPIRYRRFAPKG